MNGSGGVWEAVNGGVREAEVVRVLPCTVMLIYRASTRPNAGLNVGTRNWFLDGAACSMSGKQQAAMQ